MFSRLRHKRHYLIGIGAIGMNIARLPSPVAQSFSQCLATFILYIAYHDTGTFANECFSGGSAHSTCAPGDKNCFDIKTACTHVTRSPCLAGSKTMTRILTVGRKMGTAAGRARGG